MSSSLHPLVIEVTNFLVENQSCFTIEFGWARRIIMPHVVSQMQQREKPQQSYTPKRAMMKTSASQDNLRPPVAPRRQNTNSMTPTLSLLVTPHDAWNYTSTRQQLNHFSPDRITPISAVDSVFELSSAMTNGSPNSAVSSFIAELEDTSPGAVKPQNFNMDPKSPLSPTLSVSSRFELHVTMLMIL